MEGARNGFWQFADEAKGQKALSAYLQMLGEDSIASSGLQANDMPASLPVPIPADATPVHDNSAPEEKMAAPDTTQPATNTSNQPLQYPPVPLPAQHAH